MDAMVLEPSLGWLAKLQAINSADIKYQPHRELHQYHMRTYEEELLRVLACIYRFISLSAFLPSRPLLSKPNRICGLFFNR